MGECLRYVRGHQLVRLLWVMPGTPERGQVDCPRIFLSLRKDNPGVPDTAPLFTNR